MIRILAEDKMCRLYNRRLYIYFELFKNKLTRQQLLTVIEMIL